MSPTIHPEEVYWDKFDDFQARHLQEKSKGKIYEALYRNPKNLTEDDDVLSDWEGFAEEMDCSLNWIEKWGKRKNPEEEVFNFYATERSMTIGVLLTVMLKIGLNDYVYELQDNLEQDVEAFQQKIPIQVSPVYSVRCEEERLNGARPFDHQRTDGFGKAKCVDNKPKCVLDEERESALKLLAEEVENYDAFVSFNLKDEEDWTFVEKMVEFLETKGYKIFLRGRDYDGGARFEKYTDLISNHCRKVIILLSPSFDKCEECDWVLKYAQSLSPGARKAILVPIKRTSASPLPATINFLSHLDAELDGKRKWFTGKLLKHLGPPFSSPSPGSSSATSAFPAAAASSDASVSSAAPVTAPVIASSAAPTSAVITATGSPMSTPSTTVTTTTCSKTSPSESCTVDDDVTETLRVPTVCQSLPDSTESTMSSIEMTSESISSPAQASSTGPSENNDDDDNNNNNNNPSGVQIPQLNSKGVTLGPSTSSSSSRRNNSSKKNGQSSLSLGLGKIFKPKRR